MLFATIQPLTINPNPSIFFSSNVYIYRLFEYAFLNWTNQFKYIGNAEKISFAHLNTFRNSPSPRQSGHTFFILVTQTPQTDRWKHLVFINSASLSKHTLHRRFSGIGVGWEGGVSLVVAVLFESLEFIFFTWVAVFSTGSWGLDFVYSA